MTKTLTINGYQFDVPDAQAIKMVEGYGPLTAAEARHLFQTRCENIRNNAAAMVKKMTAEGKSAEDIASWVTQYATDYKFSMPGQGGGARVTDPVEKEQYAIARVFIKEHLAAQGRKMSDVPEGSTEEEWKEKLEANIETVANHPDTVKLAKKRVAERQRVGATSMEGINL